MAYRAQDDHLAAKALGFVFVPALSTIAGGLLASAVIGRQDDERSGARKAMLSLAATSAVGSYLAYRYSERDDVDNSAQAFARGGAWGQGINAGLYGIGAVAVDRIPAAALRALPGRDVAPRLTDAGGGGGAAPIVAGRGRGARFWDR